MATILELVERGELEKLDADLGPRELEHRCIYLLARTAAGLNERLLAMESEFDIETPPAEQFDDLTHNFVTGGELNFPRQLNALRHREDGIWELKSPDLRLFGWFPARDIFICSDVANANDVKHGPQGAANFQGSLYAGYCAQGAYFRDRLDLDLPKFITGDNPANVVSNCTVAQP